MTDIEKAVSRWLPDVWQPGQRCSKLASVAVYHISTSCSLCGARHFYDEDHDIPCPRPTPELGFRLLEAIKITARYNPYLNSNKGGWIVEHPDRKGAGVSDPDLLTAIIKAAATLVDSEVLDKWK